MKGKFFFLLLVWGIGLGGILPQANAESAENLEEAFVRVAGMVGPSVVSITTVHTEKVGLRRYYYGGSFGGRDPYDEFFDEFFRDFFGEMPEQEYRQRGLGSGVMIDPNGFVLTNAHVVEGADTITVTLPDGREFEGTLKGTDPRSDLAIVKIDAKSLPTAKLGDSDEVRIGQWAIAIGNPFGYVVNNPKPTVTVGVVSALNRSLPRTSRRDRDYTDLIQTDAAINPGNSGGPLVNLKGEVIGINVAIFTTTGGYQGVGFAIPSNTAKGIVNQLIEGKKVVYGWLGVNVQDIDANLQNYFSLLDRQGVLVVKVVDEGPAAKAGIRDGDIIRSFENMPVENAQTLIKKVGQLRVGKKVKIGVLRDNKELAFDVEISQRPEEVSSLVAEPKQVPKASWRGIKVQEVTPNHAKRLGLQDGHGVMIVEIEAGSPAEEASLRRGDVINQINRTPITNLAGYAQAIQQVRGDCLIRTQRGFAVLKEKRRGTP
ncbi:MAG: trypsin-like peptidase domain-containing protein [Candidatus Omnitrophica bacterium]|nr:trypsin-like peptidase domain-containing protein [Candidatus Omnitrophota bacterium]